jgi:hypothetical protein
MIVTGGIPRYGSINRSHALARGLVAMFRGGVGMGSAKTWYDLAGNNHATFVAAPTWKQGWVELNGTTQYGTFGGSTVLAPSGSAWSLQATVRLTDFASSSYPHIFSIKTDTTYAYEVFLSSDATYLDVTIGAVTTWSRLRTGAIATFAGLDRNILVTYNGQGAGTAGNFAVYVDGVARSLVSSNLLVDGGNTISVLGALQSGGNPFKGRIYRAGIWNRALSASEAKMLALRPDAMFNQVETPIFGGGRLRTKNLLRGKFNGLLRGKF